MMSLLVIKFVNRKFSLCLYYILISPFFYGQNFMYIKCEEWLYFTSLWLHRLKI